MTFSKITDEHVELLDKAIGLLVSKDIAAFQGIQLMNTQPDINGIIPEVDTNLTDDELAFKQAKERGSLTEDEYAYFDFKGFDVKSVGIIPA